MDLLTLIGDAEENFYQLGLNDRDGAKAVHQDVKLMLSTPWAPINKTIEEVAKVVLKNTMLKKTEYYRHLKYYSDGLGIPLEETAYTMLIPELVSCMSKWAPGFIKGNFGCSSFFMRNDQEEMVHGRILDFPLQGSYDKFERAIYYDFKDLPKTFGFGSKGIPYPSITLMTEDGMTLALHQKFTTVFNKEGIPIFELIFDMVKQAKDPESVINYFKTHHSITTWCLYMSFKNGDILAIDIMGKEVFFNQYHLAVGDKNIIYFCNHLENKSINQEEMLPTGFHQYNLMREKLAQKKIAAFNKKNKRSDIDLLKMMATPFDQKIKHKGIYSDFLLDNLTPSSLSVMTMNPSKQVTHYLGGAAPKLYRENIISINQCFNDPIKSQEKNKRTNHLHDEYYYGMQALMKAQKGFDLRDAQVIYHQLQFAIDHLEHGLERCIPEFYFLIAQYLYETHPKVLMTLLHDFKKLECHLPQILNDHCLLFISRLERILNLPNTLQEDLIIHPKLKALVALESKIPKAVFHSTTKNLIVPRLDILDVIYLHTS